MSAADAVASVGTWYHTIELPDGIVTPGVYDMRPYLHEYGLPDLDGRALADVGSSNGFFSFSFEAMGAQVQAIDLPSYKEHDLPSWYRQKRLATLTDREVEAYDWNELHGGFEVARHLLGSKVVKNCRSVYELEGFRDADFDVVFCSNVLVHVRDPILALQGMRALAKPGGTLCVATPVLDQEHESIDAASFVGLPEQPAFWVPSPRTLMSWCRFVGWRDVEFVGTYFCKRVRGDEQGDWVGVVHAKR